MLWYTGAKPKNVRALIKNTRPEFRFDDVAWALFELDNGTFAIIENIWSLPDNVPYAIDAKMEIVGTKGVIDIDNSGRNYSVLTEKGLSFPQSTYWPKVHGSRRGYLKEELEYFLKCIVGNTKPEVITPQESRDVVNAMIMAEKAAEENTIIDF
jgi:UDP-N-acetylglucosamine 3-dehydrogenase